MTDAMPPHDLAAEQSVLGSLLIDRDAIARIAGWLKPEAFFDEQNRRVYQALLWLWAKRVPGDLVTLMSELNRVNRLDAVGGVIYLSQLMEIVPTSVHVEHYADAIRATAYRRSLMDAGAALVSKAYHGDVELDAAIREIRNATTPFAQPTELREPALNAEALEDHALRVVQRWAGDLGEHIVPTGIRSIDHLIYGGFRGGELAVLGGRPGMGKALALDTPLATPDGWTTMRDITVGSVLYDETGLPCRVRFVTDVMHDRPCYEVQFSDGSTIVADAEHQWRTTTRRERQGREVGRESITTAEILDTLRVGSDQRVNHAIQVTDPLQGVPHRLPVAPYTLGAWLGDGTTGAGHISKPDEELFTLIKADGYDVGPIYGGMTRTVYGLQPTLRALGVLQNKHIPADYLRASETQRRALLAGLLDTDGHIDANGNVEFSTCIEALAEDVEELLHTLGFKVSVRVRRAMLNGKDCGPSWRIRFRPHVQVFRLSRKAAGFIPETRSTTQTRYITDVVPVPSVPVRCIQVDSPSHLFLAGKQMIPTHNTSLMLQIAKEAARLTGRIALIASLEMSREAMHNRLICAEAGIPFWVPYWTPSRLVSMADYEALPDYQDRFLQATDALKDVPMAIVEKPRTTEAIRAYLEAMPERYGAACGVLFIDHLGKLLDGVKGGNVEQETAKRTANAHQIGKDAGVPVVLLSQLSRAVEATKPYTPNLEHLRYSGTIEQDADYVMLLYRRMYYVEKDKLDADLSLDYVSPTSNQHRVALNLAKNRNGQVKEITLGWTPKSMAFTEVAA